MNNTPLPKQLPAPAAPAPSNDSQKEMNRLLAQASKRQEYLLLLLRRAASGGQLALSMDCLLAA